MKFPKRLLLGAMVSTFIANNTNAQIFVSQNFDSVSNPYLPAGWTSAPASAWTTGSPNTTTPGALNSLNISLENTAHTKAVGIDGTHASADGAIISSPVISIPSSAVNTLLEYDVSYFGLQSNNTPPETQGLVFMISTNGGATWSDVSFVAPLTSPSSSAWDTRSLSMSAYAGQSNLKFGFRYNNQGGTLIGAAFDNFRLINGTDGTVISTFSGDHPDPSTRIGYQLSGSNTELHGTIKNSGSLTINSYYIKYKVGNGAVQSSSLITTPVAPLATADFPTGLTVNIPANGNYPIRAWIETSGDIDHSNDTAYNLVVGIPYIPAKKPVFEEGTGTWCGWCPRGAVFMDHFASGHPNGVAAQIAVHNGDPMQVSAYDNYMGNYIGGFPTMVIDRTTTKDPREIDTVFATAQNNFGFADFTIGAAQFNGNTVSIPVTIKPVVTITNAKVALVITESNVKGTGSNWPQNNYYSGGGSGTMGGWENEDDHVSDVRFHFVARSISPSPEGNANGLPATLNAGMTYNATLTATLDNAWKRNDLQYIALLINGNNAAIMNSAFTSLPALSPSLGNNTAIKNTVNDIEQALLYPNPASGKTVLSVTIKEAGLTHLSVSDISGRKLFNINRQLHAGTNLVEIETDQLPAGSYFVDFSTKKTKTTLKLQVVNQ